jgi:hypothetical protein
MIRRGAVKEGFITGIIAGVVFLIIEMALVPVVFHKSPWLFPRMAAAILLDRNAVNPQVFDFGTVRLGIEIHFALSVFYTFIFMPFVRDTRLLVTTVLGMLYGVLLYFTNYYLFGYEFFPWFEDSQDWVSIVGHMGYGGTAGYVYKEYQHRDIGKYCVNCSI